MKKILLSLSLILVATYALFAQGLDGIIVEKYYVSNANDSIVSTGGGFGLLRSGSITWRIYADLATGYTLQAVYGVDVVPAGPSAGDHALKISSTVPFFNNEFVGTTTPNGITPNNMRANSVMVDTWFSMGGNATNRAAVIKAEDNDGALVNSSGMLQNNDLSAAPPINSVDGMIDTFPAPSVIFPGFTPAEIAVFDNTSEAGSSINTSNASVAVLGGVTGPIPATNRVLIGQFTTKGVFHFELNLQLGTPTAGVEKWVANSPVAGEFTMPSLTGTFNQPNGAPINVAITSPASSSYVVPANFNVIATANDTDGTVTMLELLDNGIPVDTILSPTSPDTFAVQYLSASPSSHILRVRATDDDGASTTSALITITLGSNTPPSITITSPANGTPYIAGANVNINTTAADIGGQVDSVVFFVSPGPTRIGVSTGPAFNFVWLSAAPFGPRQLSAVAWDNNLASTTSNIVTITVSDPNALAYGVVSASNTCVPSTFCQAVEARDTVDNVIGYDVVMHYDNTMVTPTGVVTVDNDLVNPAHVDAISSVDAGNGLIYISLAFNGSAPAGSEFNGTGNIFCVEFAKTALFANIDTTTISINTLQESYITGIASVPADPGTYSTFRDTSFGGSLRYWFNNTAIAYNPALPSQHLITNIYGTDAACGNQSVVAVQPDINGDFIYDINNGEKIAIKKDILAATSVQPVVNGFDAFLTRRVLVNDLSFLPNVYQMVAMDVNTDGVISSGDLSQINQRTVLIYPEYRQDWNYDPFGNPIAGAGPSKDWLFIDVATVNSSTAYLISTTYPFDDLVGYSKSRVPQIPFCLSLPNSSADTTGDCGILVSETYKGILLGDINGNFATVMPNSAFRANGSDRVVFNVTKAVVGNDYVDVPVTIQYGSDVNALDFAMQSKLTVNSVIDHTGNLQALANYNASDKTFRFTSYSLQNIATGKPVVSVRFNTTEQITAADLSTIEAYVNGERVGVDLGTNTDNMVTLFPNPATEMLNVIVSEDATVQLLDISGSEVAASSLVYANQKHEINTANLASGVYMLKVYNDNFVSMKKVVVNK